MSANCDGINVVRSLIADEIQSVTVVAGGSVMTTFLMADFKLYMGNCNVYATTSRMA